MPKGLRNKSFKYIRTHSLVSSCEYPRGRMSVPAPDSIGSLNSFQMLWMILKDITANTNLIVLHTKRAVSCSSYSEYSLTMKDSNRGSYRCNLSIKDEFRCLWTQGVLYSALKLVSWCPIKKWTSLPRCLFSSGKFEEPFLWCPRFSSSKWDGNTGQSRTNTGEWQSELSTSRL